MNIFGWEVAHPSDICVPHGAIVVVFGCILLFEPNILFNHLLIIWNYWHTFVFKHVFGNSLDVLLHGHCADWHVLPARDEKHLRLALFQCIQCKYRITLVNSIVDFIRALLKLLGICVWNVQTFPHIWPVKVVFQVFILLVVISRAPRQPRC